MMDVQGHLEQKDWDALMAASHAAIILRKPSGDIVHGWKDVGRALRDYPWPALKQVTKYENILVGEFEGSLQLKVKFKDRKISRLYLTEVIPGIKRYRLDCAYDGTLYHGFQRQRGKHTVQGEIEGVLRHITQERITVTPSGRTDRGVHAKRQTLHFDTGSPLEEGHMLSLMKRMLPGDIEALSLHRVPNVFHARFDASMKTYHYVIIREKDPFMAHYAWHCPTVDATRLNARLSSLEGTHDFSAFGKGTDGSLTTRTVRTARAYESAGRIIVEIKSEGFLRHMVRYMVGTAVRDMNRGTRKLEHAIDHPQQGQVYLAPACGLVLQHVEYGLEK